MDSPFKSSPYRRRRDLEAGDPSTDDESSGPFDILSTKNASIERLRRWRVIEFSLSLTVFLFRV